MIKLNPGKTVVCDSFTLTDKYGKSVENLMKQCPADKTLTVRAIGGRWVATICTPVVMEVKVITKPLIPTKVEKKLPKKIIKSKKKGKKK